MKESPRNMKLTALLSKPKIATQDLAVFFRQFATLISAGIPLLQACIISTSSQHNAVLNKLLSSIKRDLLSGKTLSQSLQQQTEYITPFIQQLIHISEHTGRLDHGLQNIALHLEKSAQLKEQIQRALFYPCLIIIIGLVVTLGMLIFIVPRFAELFHDFPQTLPAISRAIFWLSELTQSYAWLLPLLILAITLIIKKSTYTWLLRLPWIKHVYQTIHLSRFTRQLGMTLTAGIPINQALTLTCNPTQPTSFTIAIKRVNRQVRSGMRLHQAMLNAQCFPPLLIQMTKIGEESGQLDSLLLKSADIMDQEIERLLNRLIQLLEPLIMVILGVLIGGLVTGMYLPIFKLGSII